jgi:hypothetical protein
MTRQELGFAPVLEITPVTGLEIMAVEQPPKKKKTLSPEHRKAIGDALRGRKKSPETRRRISEGLKGHRLRPETRAKISRAHRGKKFSPEHRRKISKAVKKLAQDPEYLKKVSEGMRMWWEEHPEAREKMSAIVTEQWQDPHYREKVLEARKLAALFQNPDIDRELWGFAKKNGYLAKIVAGGMVTEAEIEALRNFFDGEDGAKKRLPLSLLDRFSLALAQTA